MKKQLTWAHTPEGIVFSLAHCGQAVPFDDWAMISPKLDEESRLAIPVLSGHVEGETASVTADGDVELSTRAIAALKREHLLRLGLPPTLPHAVAIEGHGLISDDDFSVSYRFRDNRGRELVAPRRRGAFVEVGREIWTLSNPLHSLIERIDAFDSSEGQSRDERFLAWGEIRTFLPEDAIVDGYLQEMHVAFATATTLDFRTDERGEFNIDPVLVRKKTPRAQEDGATAPEAVPGDVLPPRDEYERSLPEAHGQALAKQFRRFGSAKDQYALGGGWYVVVDEPARQALQVVHEMQETTEAERRRFARNPHAVFRERLSEDLSEDVLNSLFYEPADYGDRVAEAGLWKPKVLPFLQQAAQGWLPPERVGLEIDGKEVPIDIQEIPQLRERVEKAIEEGEPTVEQNGTQIPASHEALRALETLEEETRAFRQPRLERHEPRPPRERQVLLLQEKDNVEELVYAKGDLTPRSGSAGTPGGLRSVLQRHQETGLAWMQKHWLEGTGGALLADDMGLGKTLVCLTFLLWMQLQNEARDRSEPVLIVAPTGLLKNWLDEHDKHLDPPGLGRAVKAYGAGLRALRHPGTGRLREGDSGAPVLRVSELERADYVLTTFETLRDYAHSFGRVRWSAMILDEAQKIKNPGALVTEECKAVASNADFVAALTGTPVENRLADLWSISDTCQPGILGSLNAFVRQYDTQSERSSEDLESLRRRLLEGEEPVRIPLILRRMKWQELEGLPEKHVQIQREAMPSEQAESYMRTVRYAQTCNRDLGAMLTSLHEMRKISLHPDWDADMPDDTYIKRSARFARAFGILDQIAEKAERVLVFLEFLDIQPILQGLIQRRYGLKRPPLIINGGVNGDRRKQLVDLFQQGQGFGAMILSPRAGGLGLTLTSANHVVHLSRWWNPAVEDQCTDRIYRIGQEKPVYVHIPLAVHPKVGEYSFDERLNLLLERKRELSRAVLGLAPTGETKSDFEELFQDTVGAVED